MRRHLHVRLYSLLTILEAVLVLDASEWLCLCTEDCWARPSYLISDTGLGSPFSEFLWAMPLTLLLLTNVAGWYLLRHDNLDALRFRDKAARVILLWAFNALVARLYYQTLLYHSFLDPQAMMVVCLVEGLFAAVYCVLIADFASCVPFPGVPASLLWLWDGDGMCADAETTPKWHPFDPKCSSKEKGSGVAMTTDGDLYYMKTQVWEGDTFDGGLREIYASLYAADGAHDQREAIDILLKQGSDIADMVIERYVTQELRLDRYFADCLFPVAAHLDDWKEQAHGIRLLLDDLRISCEMLQCVTSGNGLVVSGQRGARDGNFACEAEVWQRLSAYEAVLAMVLDSHEGMLATLGDIVRDVRANLEYLFGADNVPDRYTMWCDSVAGTPVCGAEYWCEPLFIVAEAAEVTGRKTQVCAAIDKITEGLAAIDTEHEKIRSNIWRQLSALRSGLDHGDE